MLNSIGIVGSILNYLFIQFDILLCKDHELQSFKSIDPNIILIGIPSL